MKRAVLPLLVVLVLSAPPHTGWVGGGSAQASVLQEVESRLKRVLTELSEQRNRLRLVRRKERQLLGELEGIDRTKDQAERKLTELGEDYQQTQLRAKEVSVQLQRAQEHLTVRRRVLGARLRDIYKYGRTGYAEVLLGSDDFAAFVIRWQLISTIVHADAAALDGHAADVTRYQRLQASLAQDQAYLRTLTAHTEVRQREIAATELAKREMLERLQVERAAYERVVRELEKNSKDLEAMIRKAQIPPRRPTMAEAHIRFAFLWPTRGLFTSGFGMRRHPLFGIWHLHTGVDIATAWGAPVLAAAEGRVIYAGWFGGDGEHGGLGHRGGRFTPFCHPPRPLLV